MKHLNEGAYDRLMGHRQDLLMQGMFFRNVLSSKQTAKRRDDISKTKKALAKAKTKFKGVVEGLQKDKKERAMYKHVYAKVSRG
jgi:hypothetical protein